MQVSRTRWDASESIERLAEIFTRLLFDRLYDFRKTVLTARRTTQAAPGRSPSLPSLGELWSKASWKPSNLPSQSFPFNFVASLNNRYRLSAQVLKAPKFSLPFLTCSITLGTTVLAYQSLTIPKCLPGTPRTGVIPRSLICYCVGVKKITEILRKKHKLGNASKSGHQDNAGDKGKLT